MTDTQMLLTDFEKQLNEWGSRKIPFLFLVDFEMIKPQAWRMSDVDSEKILFNFKGITNSASRNNNPKVSITAKPISFESYQKKFNVVMDGLLYGNSFLTNLTIKTPIELNHSLLDAFHIARAPYKLFYQNQFLVFSPETFVTIRNQKIYSHPMKGTIDARIPNAEKIVLDDKKELAEHVTIVDLIRNDLSIVSKNVSVKRFRYIERIETNSIPLLQVSSEIEGDLHSDYQNNLGTILVSILPAGSISGAPKDKTVAIIKEAENEPRGFYTGVFGYFDGVKLESAVMIRFIERTGNNYYYRSGGGITTQSTAKQEYDEALSKIYVPLV